MCGGHSKGRGIKRMEQLLVWRRVPEKRDLALVIYF
jgi:hypothetical protein